MKILIQKRQRLLSLQDNEERLLLSCPIALGFSPEGHKEKEGDGKTPEGDYFVCLKKMGKYGFSLGISYPNEKDARKAGASDDLISCIRKRAEKNERPPWGSALGGEIYIHGGGTERDWTAGCIALSDEDAKRLYQLVPIGTKIKIIP